jgi:ubiquinone/menaquinone biosynthesis C-methylase UbiE
MSTPWLSSRLLGPFLRTFFHHLYTTLAWAYDFVAWASSAGQWDAWRSIALRWLPAQGRILELGPGTGHLLRAMRLQGRDAYGLEASPQMARLARRRADRGGSASPVVRGMGQAQPFPTACFDAIVSTFPSEYILDPVTLSEVRRSLRPGGSLVVIAAAWPTGRAWVDRLASWLYRVTGQAILPESAWAKSLQASSFPLEVETVERPRGLVVVFHGVAPDSRGPDR